MKQYTKMEKLIRERAIFDFIKRCLKYTGCLLFIFGMHSTVYANTQEEQAVSQLDKSLLDLEHTNPWPAFDISVHPIIATFDNQHNYAYYFSPKNPHWLKRSNQPLSYYLTQDDYQIDHIPWSFGNIIDGQSAFIFNLDTLFKVGSSADETLHVLFHERFHIFQFDNFPSDIYLWKKTEGFNQIENVKLTVLEDAALIHYLETRDLEHLKNYLAISAYRKTLNDPDSYDYEIKKENMEGMADYYGWIMAINNPDLRIKAMIENYKDQCAPDSIVNCLIQHRYYFTGNVEAIALDQLDSQWKEKLVQKHQFVRNQLFDHYPMTSVEITQRVAFAKNEYHYNKISKPVVQAIQLYSSQRDMILKKWNTMDAVSLVVARSPCNLFGMTAYNKRYYINSDVWFQVETNGPSQCEDGSISVNYIHTPLLKQTEHNGEMEFKIPHDSMIEINHNAFSAMELLSHNKNYVFKDFYLKTPTIEITVKNRSGELKIVDGKIELITGNTFIG